MNERGPWGVQIGGIHAPEESAGADLGPLDWPEAISLDHRLRVAEFIMRHGGPTDSGGRNELMELGCRGWSEIYAADGYVLRVEWSRFELRTTMRVFELPTQKRD
jgi:hypothetical protein